MKKMFLMLVGALVCSMSFSQKTSKFSYKVGLATSLPVEQTGTHIGFGSTFLEASSTLIKSKKITETFNTGVMRFTSSEGNFAQVPILLGAKYKVNQNVYFGVSAGASIFTGKDMGNPQFTYTPYIGVQVNKISAEARYFNSFNDNKDASYKTIGLVFGYTL